MGTRRLCIITSGILLLWFFLDMTGLTVGRQMLVSRSWKDDGIFFVIFAGVFILFILKERIGKFVLLGWLVLWFAVEFYSHWYFTIAGPWAGKIRYFSDTIKLIPSSVVYVPDLYHIVLHLLILFSAICVLVRCLTTRGRKNMA